MLPGQNPDEIKFSAYFENRIAGADQDVLQSETEFQVEQADLAQTTLNLALRFAADHAEY